MGKIFIFDVDGVLNTYKGIEYRKYLSDLSRIPLERVVAFVNPCSDELRAGKIDLNEFNKRISKEIGIKKEEVRWLEYYKEMKVRQDIVDIVKNLKSKGNIIVLMSNEDSTRGSVIKSQFGRLADFFFPSYEIGILKPAPQAYEYVVDKLSNALGRSIPYEEIVFVDNRVENVKAAEALGMHGIVFSDAPQLRKALGVSF